MSDVFAETPAQSERPTIFFDGVSSRRRQVTLTLGDALEIAEDGATPVRWAYADIRRADGPPGILRLAATSAPPLARLEIRDAVLAADVTARCLRLDEHQTTRGGIGRIVGWSTSESTLPISLFEALRIVTAPIGIACATCATAPSANTANTASTASLQTRIMRAAYHSASGA